MKKMCIAHLGVILLTLYVLSSQVVQAQNATDGPMTATASTVTNATINGTQDKNASGRMDAFTLLLPLALAASLLLGCSQ